MSSSYRDTGRCGTRSSMLSSFETSAHFSFHFLRSHSSQNKLLLTLEPKSVFRKLTRISTTVFGPILFLDVLFGRQVQRNCGGYLCHVAKTS